MFQVGDVVISRQDGASGLVVKTNQQTCHVLWEDFFCSHEPFERLMKDDQRTRQQRVKEDNQRR
jgi:hypothetical protein